jgi:hypothetical protein
MTDPYVWVLMGQIVCDAVQNIPTLTPIIHNVIQITPNNKTPNINWVRRQKAAPSGSSSLTLTETQTIHK